MEGPFERREEGRNPVASELERLAEQDRVHRLGEAGATTGGPQAGVSPEIDQQWGERMSHLGALAQHEQAPEGTPPNSSWYNPDRVAGRKAFAGMSDADLATSVSIARQSLE